MAIQAVDNTLYVGDMAYEALLDMLCYSGIAESRNAARRLVRLGAVSLTVGYGKRVPIRSIEDVPAAHPPGRAGQEG